MCGITGIIATNGAVVDKNVLSSMSDALAHRGPDAHGMRIDLQACDECLSIQVGLAHRRLSIIDLSHNAAQPMSNENGTIWIVFNGEIYNFAELRTLLEERGHVFKSKSDTEVLLHGYEEWGVSLPLRLNGMFAFAIWDPEQRKVFMARDRFGKKPLYYHLSKYGLIFASELTALMRHPDIPEELDIPALGRYLLHEYVPAPHSMVRGVAKLEPGHMLEWTPSETKVTRYWEPRIGGADMSLAEAAAKFRDLFIRAVERRLISDVPLGVFLSGGIDSSCVVAAMRECVDASKIQTFAIGFQEKSFDEAGYARESAKYFGVTHREEILTAQRMLEILPEVFAFLDEPLADASIIPTYLLSSFARRHVTVALGGDGGDELFAGYDPFAALWAASIYEHVPPKVRSLIEGVASRLPVSTRNMSLDFKIKRFLKGFRYSPSVRLQAWMAGLCPDEQHEILAAGAAKEALAKDPFEAVQSRADEANLRNQVEAAIHYYQSWYLSGDIMTKVDRASMAVSLEVRAPFLDADLVEFVNSLPPAMKYHRGVRKHLLRETFKDILPPEVLSRSKKGFGIPLAAWLKKDLLSTMHRLFAKESLCMEGLFKPEAVERLIQEHISGKVDHRKQLWTLLMFQGWLERHRKINTKGPLSNA